MKANQGVHQLPRGANINLKRSSSNHGHISSFGLLRSVKMHIREETGPVGPPDRTDPQPPPGPARAQGHPQRTGPTGPEHSQRRTDRTEIRALQSDGTTIVSIYQIALKFVGSSQLLAW